MESLINSLLRNGYSLQLLFKIIKNRIKFLSNKNKFETINEYDRESNLNSVGNKKYFSIPYLQGVSEKFNGALNKYKFQLVHKPMNNLSKFIKTGKDRVKKDERSNIVYKIECKDCDYSYVGQTKRKLKTRLKEHIKDLKKPVESLSVISNHRIDKDHIEWIEIILKY